MMKVASDLTGQKTPACVLGSGNWAIRHTLSRVRIGDTEDWEISSQRRKTHAYAHTYTTRARTRSPVGKLISATQDAGHPQRKVLPGLPSNLQKHNWNWTLWPS